MQAKKSSDWLVVGSLEKEGASGPIRQDDMLRMNHLDVWEVDYSSEMRKKSGGRVLVLSESHP